MILPHAGDAGEAQEREIPFLPMPADAGDAHRQASPLSESHVATSSSESAALNPSICSGCSTVASGSRSSKESAVAVDDVGDGRTRVVLILLLRHFQQRVVVVGVRRGGFDAERVRAGPRGDDVHHGLADAPRERHRPTRCHLTDPQATIDTTPPPDSALAVEGYR